MELTYEYTFPGGVVVTCVIVQREPSGPLQVEEIVAWPPSAKGERLSARTRSLSDLEERLLSRQGLLPASPDRSAQ